MLRNEFINEDVVLEIVDLVRRGDEPGLTDRLDTYHDYDLAKAFEALTPEERRSLYKRLGEEWTAQIFSYYDEPADRIAELSPTEAAGIIEHMDSDEAMELLENTDRNFCREVVRKLSPDSRGEIKLLASYRDDEIGGLMSTNYICIRKTISVKQAMRELIRQSEDNDNISTIYVVDENDRYYGAIDLKELILAREHTPLEDIITTSYPFVHDQDDIETCMDWLRDYEEDSIPVLNAESRLVGVVTMQDLVEYMEEESKGVYNKLAGISDGDNEDMSEPTMTSMKKRMPWLVALLLLGMFVSSVVGAFEGLVSQIAILICFQSLILDMAGNVGTQSLAVTIRVLMDEEAPFSVCASLIAKEVKVGLLNGGILGTISFIVVGLYIMLFKGEALSYAFAVSGCVGLALMAAMAISSFSGTAIPLFFNHIKIDPAVASGPLITTVNDLVAVVTYYGLAWIMLVKVMHLV